MVPNSVLGISPMSQELIASEIFNYLSYDIKYDKNLEKVIFSQVVT
jgi:hypothetical protein